MKQLTVVLIIGALVYQVFVPGIVYAVSLEERTTETEQIQSTSKTQVEEETSSESLQKEGASEESKSSDSIETIEPQKVEQTSPSEPKEARAYQASIEEIIKNAPQGLRTTDIFRRANTSENNAKVYYNKEKNTDIVMITDDTGGSGGQKGAIWSDPRYRIDLTKPFHAKMKIYLDNKGTDASDGMAFVLQNDRDQIDSDGFSNALGDDSGGGSLGLMGRGTESNDKPWQNAIQNSFAFEFDSYVNDGGLDRGTGEGEDPAAFHIAGYYPAVRESYNNNEPPAIYHSKQTPILNFDSDHHQSDGTWHNFEVNYERIEENGQFRFQLSYTFVDGEGTAHSRVIDSLELSRLGVTKEDPYIYWGFTGATGKLPTVQAVVFTELPELGTTEYKQDVLNQENQSVNGSKDLVKSGDQLFYEYHIDYVKGHQSTDKLSINAAINQKISLGNIEELKKKIEVTYQDQSGNLIKSANNDELSITYTQGNLQISGLKELGDREPYYRKVHVRVPIIVDQAKTLTEPYQVRDSFTVREGAYQQGYTVDAAVENRVSYTINPILAQVFPDEVTDLMRDLKPGEVSITGGKKQTELTGKIESNGVLDDLKITAKGPGLLDEQGNEVELTGQIKDGHFKFDLDLKNQSQKLIAGKKIVYTLSGGSLITPTQTEVIVKDGTPPTGTLKEKYYTLINQLPDPGELLSEFSDNKDVKEELILEYQGNERENSHSPWGRQGEDAEHQSMMPVAIKITDQAGNSVTVKQSMLEVLRKNLWISAKDQKLTTKELLEGSPDQAEVMPNRQRIADEKLLKLFRQGGLSATYIDLEKQAVKDVTEHLIIEDLAQIGYQPKVYAQLKAMINQAEMTETESFKLTVSDGKLSFSAPELIYQPKISTAFNQLTALSQPSLLSVEDGRYGADHWRLSVKATPFRKAEEIIDPKQIDLIAKIGNQEPQSLISSEGVIIRNQALGQQVKSLKDNDLRKDQVRFELKTNDSSWVRKNEDFSAKIDWNLSSDDSELKNLSFMKPKKKGG